MVLLALVTGATAGALDGGEPGQTPRRVLVGDLHLSDDDEPPSESVTETFTGSNLAPGDTAGGVLVILREPFHGLALDARGLTPRVAIDVDPVGEDRLASVLEVTTLRYGERSLAAATERACGTPLALDRLAACTDRQRHPLSNLPDPTPDGRELELRVRLMPEAGNALQGTRAGVTVHVTLKALPIERADVPLAPAASPAPSLPCAPLELPRPPASIVGVGSQGTGGSGQIPMAGVASPLWPGGVDVEALLATHLGPCEAAVASR